MTLYLFYGFIWQQLKVIHIMSVHTLLDLPNPIRAFSIYCLWNRNLPASMNTLALDTATVLLHTAHLFCSIYGFICRWEQLVTSEDYCEYATGKKRYSLNECWALWRPASMQHISTTKASLWCLRCPSDWNKPNYRSHYFNKFTRQTAILQRGAVLLLLETHGTKFDLISMSCPLHAR